MDKNKKVKTAADIIDVAGNVARVKILELLAKEGEISVNDIVAKTKGKQSLTSHHLKLLAKVGYAKKRRSGKSILYSIHSWELYKIIEIATKYLKEEIRPKKLTKKERNTIYKYLLKTVNSKVWGDCFLCWKFYKHLGLQEKDWWGESDTIKREQRVFNEFPEFSKAYKEFILGNRWLHEASQRKIVLNRCIELSK